MIRILIAVAVAVFSAAAAVRAQDTTGVGALQGVVRDAIGPGAAVIEAERRDAA